MRLLALALVLAACPDEPTFDLDARAWVEAGTCWGASELVGTTTQEACDDVMTVASDSDGACWLFTNSCIPDDFTEGCTLSPDVNGDLCE